MPGIDNYDQWKTASPFDDDDDFVEKGERWLQYNSHLKDLDPDMGGILGELAQTFQVIDGLVDYIQENI